MPLAVRLLLFLVPKDRKTLGVILMILLLPVLFLFFLGSSTVMFTHVPAIKPEEITEYKQAVIDVFAEYNLMVEWKELIAIDAVRYRQDFSQTSPAKIRKLAYRFIKEVKTKDDEGNTIVYYILISLEEVVAEMIEKGELVEGDLERIYNYLRFPWDATSSGDNPELPSDYIPLPGNFGLIFPVVGEWHVSSGFYKRINPVTGHEEFHKGIDLASPEGTPVVAAKAGKVVVAGFNDKAGNQVKIDHGDGTMTRYLHLYSFFVSPGQIVEAGQPIGKVGSTGQSTGSHLHFELHINGNPVNPAKYILN